jgi:hypothetical protein
MTTRNTAAHQNPSGGARVVSPPSSGMSRVLAGISVPDTPVIALALDRARSDSEAYLFNHAVRSWLFAARIAQLKSIAHDGEVLAIGTLLHDLTLTKDFKGPRRFEVEAADIARGFVREQGFDDRRAQLIWDSVALNSTPSIGFFKEAEVALCTAGIGLDWAGWEYDRFPSEEMAGILSAFPRLDMKRRFTDSVCGLVEASPDTTYDNFTRDFGERLVPGYKSASAVDVLMNAPFAE